jgi:Protein kinase domain
VLPWAMQLCDVLAYLHTQIPKIIFRDLKPSNIMVTDQGRVKLIDFGIVRFFKPGKSKDTMALGTPGFASPEALSGQTDERSDIYSLCVTLHNLMTLQDPINTLFNIPPIRKLNPEISPEMERIIMCGVQNQRELRWRNVPQMQMELMNLAGKRADQRTASSSVGMVASVTGTVMATPHEQPIAQKRMVSEASPLSPAPVEPTRITPSADFLAFPKAQPAKLLKTSRPTMRLVMTAARLSPRQFAFLIVFAVIGIAALTWLLAPLLEELPINWNNVPLMAIFGAFGYSALPRRGMAFISHTVLSIVLVGTIWLKLGSQTYEWLFLLLAAISSGAFMEIWVTFLPRIKGDRGDEFWRGEVLWLMVMAVVGCVIFFEIVTQGYTGLGPVQLIISAILGAIGWFWGDFLRQFLYYRKTGIRRGG